LGELQDGFGDGVVVVAEDVAFVDEVAGDWLDSQGTDAVEVGEDGGLAFAGVPGEDLGADGGGIDEGVVEDLRVFREAAGAGVVEDFFEVLGGGEAKGFVGLGHEVADVDAGGAGGGEGFRDAADEEVGDEGGVKGAGAEGDEVGGGDGGEGFGERCGVGGGEHELGDGVVGCGDAGFAVDEGAVVHAGGEGGVGSGAGVDAATGGEDLGAGLDGLGEVSGDAGEGGEEEVAEAVAFEVALGKTVLEELGEQGFVFREGDEAVAEVAGGKDVEVFAEAAGGATVVGDGDDGGEFADEAGEGLAVGGGCGGAYGSGDEALEAAEERGEAGAAADGDYAKLLGRCHASGTSVVGRRKSAVVLFARGEDLGARMVAQASG